jgi:hypothetical protein
MFIIEDELHAEWIGKYATRVEAVAELQRFAVLAWDEPPNRAPCTSSATCGRNYELVEFDDATLPWRELRREPALKVSKEGVECLLAGL